MPWRNVSRRLPRALPQGMGSWMLDPGSMTEFLMRSSGKLLRVQLLHQGWRRPELEEARLLGIPTRRRVFQRVVLLEGRGEPWLFAWTLSPLGGGARFPARLRRLGNNPLGGLLFRQRQLQRGPFELAHLPAGEYALPEQYAPPRKPLWARRSVFTVRGQALLVSEVFLPRFQPIGMKKLRNRRPGTRRQRLVGL